MINEHGGSWSVERVLLVLTFVCSVLAFTFGIGVNWARLTSQESAIDALQKNTVNREVYSVDQRYLADSIDRLAKAIDRLQDEQRTARPRATPPSR